MSTIAALAKLTDAERAKYEFVWKHDAYRAESPSERCIHTIIEALDLATMQGPATVLDLGCGTGLTASRLAELYTDLNFCGVDIAENAVQYTPPNVGWLVSAIHELPLVCDPAEAAYCVDVLEHIPPVLIDATLRRIAGLVEGKVYFRIALFEDHFGKIIGTESPLHLTVKPATWWRDTLRTYWGRVDGVTLSDPHHGQPVFSVVCSHPHADHV